MWGQNLIAGSKAESTHKLRKDEVGGGVSIQSQAQRTRARTSCGRIKSDVGSASDRRLKGQEHSLPVEGQNRRWGQHPITGSKVESTHKLWKDKVGDRVSF